MFSGSALAAVTVATGAAEMAVLLTWAETEAAASAAARGVSARNFFEFMT
jgi:hypothetical protein